MIVAVVVGGMAGSVIVSFATFAICHFRLMWPHRRVLVTSFVALLLGLAVTVAAAYVVAQGGTA